MRLHKIHTREHLKTDYSVHKDEAKRYLAKNANKSNGNNGKKMVMVSYQQGNTRGFLLHRPTQGHQETVKMVYEKRGSNSKRPSTAKETVSRREDTSCSGVGTMKKSNSRVIESSNKYATQQSAAGSASKQVKPK